MEKKEVIEIALLAGEILISSGAEVYRVEETMRRICKSYNYNCESFVTPSGIFVTCSDDIENVNERDYITHVKRIKTRNLDLHRVELVNAFSRNIERDPKSYEEAIRELQEIASLSYFKFPTRLIASGITSLTLCMLFKGSLTDSIIAGIISMGIYIFNTLISRLGSFQFLQLFASGVLASATSVAASNVIPGLSIDKITLGAVMILLPGLSLTNGIKDALYGDIVSSVARIGEALYVVAAVGAGVAVIFSL